MAGVEIKFINEDTYLQGLNKLLKNLLMQAKVKEGIYEIRILRIQRNIKQEKKMTNLSVDKADNVKIPFKNKIYFVDMRKPQWYNSQEWNHKIYFAIKLFNEYQPQKKYEKRGFDDYLFHLCIKVNGRCFKPWELITNKDVRRLGYKDKHVLYSLFYQSKYLVRVKDFPGYFDWDEGFLDVVRKVKPNLGIEEKMSIKVTISVGKHSTQIPKGMSELLEKLLIAAEVKSGEYKARLGKFLKGSRHRQGVEGMKVKKYVDNGVYIVAQPGSNDTACEIILLSPNGKDLKDWYFTLKLGAKRLRKKKKVSATSMNKYNLMKKLCLEVNAQNFRPSQVITEKDVEDYGYKNKASLLSSIYNDSKYVCKMPNKRGIFSWQDNFVQELKTCVKPDLGFEKEEPKKEKTVVAVDELENNIFNLKEKIHQNKNQKEILQQDISDLLKSQKYLKAEIGKMQNILEKKRKEKKEKNNKLLKINKELKQDIVDFDKLTAEAQKREKELKLSKIFNDLVVETGSKEKAIDKLLDLLDQ